MLENLNATISAGRSSPQSRLFTMLCPLFLSMFLSGCGTAEGECSGSDCKEAPPAAVDVCSTDARLYINEFMSKNEITVADESGKTDDWIEIFNR